MENAHLYEQLVRLGDLMGDGCHLEPDGKRINSYVLPPFINSANACKESISEKTEKIKCKRLRIRMELKLMDGEEERDEDFNN